jgi:hypothetical protein
LMVAGLRQACVVELRSVVKLCFAGVGPACGA